MQLWAYIEYYLVRNNLYNVKCIRIKYHLAVGPPNPAEVSWWPKPNTWKSSQANYGGFWTQENEDWYRKHQLGGPSATPYPKRIEEWQKHLQLKKETPVFYKNLASMTKSKFPLFSGI